MSVATVESYNVMKAEESHLIREQHDSIGLSGQEVAWSRQGESDVQWVQLFQALDHQGNNKVSNGSRLDNYIEENDHQTSLISCSSKVNGMKEPVALKSNAVSAKSTYDHLQILKLPEAVVAFAQAAAKANGEPEKCIPGWPLLTPPKLQFQKCDKCSRDFCSQINYRRHSRLHRKSLNIDKDSEKKRELLGAFWDNLSMNEAKKVASFKDVTVEGANGSSIIKALVTAICNPIFSPLPHFYLNAGSILLDVIQGKPSIFPMTSQRLFSLLDDASEKTFLCGGTALSLQKFVFDAEVGKSALDMKNVVAYVSFLFEQKLVKAWHADKDAEALRWQELLVEEEEAAQRRLAELLERKRLKKLRHKEQKAKELSHAGMVHANSSILNAQEMHTINTMPEPNMDAEEKQTTITSTERTMSSIELLSMIDKQSLEPINMSNYEVESSEQLDSEAQYAYQSDDCGIQSGSRRRQTKGSRRIRQKFPGSDGLPNGFLSGQLSDVKLSSLDKHHEDWKSKFEAQGQSDLSSKSEVLIGSITVVLEAGNGNRQDAVYLMRHHPHDKFLKPDSGATRSSVKLWRPLSRSGNSDSSTAEIDSCQTSENGFSADTCIQTSDDITSASDVLISAGSASTSHPVPFSRPIAEAFLAQRWKKALAADYVKLAYPPETDAKDNLGDHEDVSSESMQVSHLQLGKAHSDEQPLTSNIRPRSRANEKNNMLKYVPKRRK